SSIYKVNLLEKLLATTLAKISNFIPEAGIWMNTQRPEWNDANNALVGNGVSMVTLNYLRRFFGFFKSFISGSGFESVEISNELLEFFQKVNQTLADNQTLLSGKLTDTERKTVLDGLGIPGSDFRERIYKKGFSGRKSAISKEELLKFIDRCLEYFDHSIEATKRPDNLYHAYNLMTLKNDQEIQISYLPEMLEGQVAVLSAGYLSSESALNVLDNMKSSSLFREDQYSYTLYPNKELPRFTKKNNLPKEEILKSSLVSQLLEENVKDVIVKDVLGEYHFNGNFNNAKDLEAALDGLSEGPYAELVKKDRSFLLELFEKNFNHKAFTGRSGTFYGYEGLGSIYWHMVSKLSLAVQEVCLKGIEEKADPKIIGRLMDHYYEVNEGIGVHKSPELYGAFPIDPYSHTPATKGAQQPGMTGQVKEDILCRLGELGISVDKGMIHFNPVLLRRDEFLTSPGDFEYLDVKSEKRKVSLSESSLAFTYCQVPVVYQLADKEEVRVDLSDGSRQLFPNLELNEDISSKIFSRTGKIEKVMVSVKNNDTAA
ncbi:MAG: hypothetical protein HKN16_09345, partial [Saprospiraceae bacterium]|nr:hypothetical protein [Saprospiraceae bacterium]